MGLLLCRRCNDGLAVAHDLELQRCNIGRVAAAVRGDVDDGVLEPGGGAVGQVPCEILLDLPAVLEGYACHHVVSGFADIALGGNGVDDVLGGLHTAQPALRAERRPFLHAVVEGGGKGRAVGNIRGRCGLTAGFADSRLLRI